MKRIFSLAILCLLAIISQSQTLLPDSVTLQKNFIIEDSVFIPTRDGTLISAIIARKKGVDKPLPSILIYTIYARHTDLRKVVEAADKGYVGVMAYTRGKRYSSGKVLAYEYDGEDIYDVINWISKQSWSDQRVGMYGGSYNGFTSWASTKKLHPSLKTIVPSASVAPGIDVPMMNNVTMSFPFSWTYYVSNNKFLDEEDYRSRIWDSILRKWYQYGGSYRSLDTLAGRPGNEMFHHWIEHPTYDKYWQQMIPYKKEFEQISIPVLQTTGYYDGGQIGTIYYLREHYKYFPKAEHYLLIGPYGHFGSQGFPDSIYNGYKIDPVANISIHEIIYQWFDYIFKGKPKPAILKDKINYQVMGTNTWKHKASLQKTSNDTITFYMDKISHGDSLLLSLKKPLLSSFTTQKIDFADRSEIRSYYYANNILYDTVYHNGLVFATDRFQQPTEITGSFSGALKATINKKDMDFSLVLFEQKAYGQYMFLSYFMGRASYAKNNMKRQLLIPGRKETIPFSNSYFTSKQIEKGSRLVVILNINKSPFEQINYGTGKNVSDETIADAKEPLMIQWHNDSYIKVPVFK